MHHVSQSNGEQTAKLSPRVDRSLRSHCCLPDFDLSGFLEKKKKGGGGGLNIMSPATFKNSKTHTQKITDGESHCLATRLDEPGAR